MANNIWVFCEQRDGELQNVALELLETRYPAVADDKEKEKKNDKKDKDKEKKVSDGKASEASPEGENDK